MRFAAGQASEEATETVPAATPSGGSGGGGRTGRRSSGGGRALRRPAAASEEDVKEHIDDLQEKSRGLGSFSSDWRGSPGHTVAYRFRMKPPPVRVEKNDRNDPKQARVEETASYTDYAGLRFPTLETAENYDYYKDRGLDRIVERAFPIKVPGHRRLDPYLREFIHFLHRLDPVRFTVERIAERYRLRKNTVAKVVSEWGTNVYLTRSGLTKLRRKQQTKESVILAAKEASYAKWVGWDQMGDADDPETDDEALGEFRGWRSTSDWIRKQTVEVEMMKAFPMPEKRDPMPKRVDVDMTVDSKEHHKVINWIDPTDKVVF